LIAAPAEEAPGRVGYVIGRKVIRRAVDRNRLRRRLREVIRAARPAVERYDVVLRVRRLLPREALLNAVGESRQLVQRLLETAPQESAR
jgi:ribonuclease P protein component